MKLDDFLKCTKVRCVNFDATGLTNKEYELLGVTDRSCIINDNGCEIWVSMDNFEPVLDSAENLLENMKLTPEFETEASEPKFQVKDKVYVGLTGKIARVTKIIDDDVVSVANKNNEVRAWISNICHATTESYERLQATFTDIEFEAQPKPLTGSDLARAMVNKGWFIVDCYVSAISDEDALRFRNKRMQVTFFSYGLFTDGVKQFPFAVLFDQRTGEPLTESVLDE